MNKNEKVNAHVKIRGLFSFVHDGFGEPLKVNKVKSHVFFMCVCKEQKIQGTKKLLKTNVHIGMDVKQI